MENNNQTEKVEKRLYRSSTNRIIFGVCGGLGEYFDLDPILFRIIFILFTFCAGSGVLIYLILAFLIPRNPSSAPVENKSERDIDAKERVHELAEELRQLKRSERGKRHGVFRLFFGLLILIIGFGILAQNLGLFPGLNINFYTFFFNLWPVLIILVGFSILVK